MVIKPKYQVYKKGIHMRAVNVLSQLSLAEETKKNRTSSLPFKVVELPDERQEHPRDDDDQHTRTQVSLHDLHMRRAVVQTKSKHFKIKTSQQCSLSSYLTVV